MDIKGRSETLHSLERKILPYLDQHTDIKGLAKASGMQEIEVTRAVQWLQNKEFVKINTKIIEQIIVTDLSKSYKELPERTVLNNLSEKETGLNELKKKTKLNDAEINATIGLLKKKAAIDISKDKELKIKLNNNGKKLLKEKTPEEKLFAEILERGSYYKPPMFFSELNDEDKLIFENLRSRGLVSLNIYKELFVVLTEDGRELIKQKIDTNIIESLTSEIIRNKEWKKKKLRAYDIKAKVPAINRGKRHFVDQSIDYVKRIWLDLGFKEMSGNIVQTSFWDLDALFVPQDHTAREMQDTFFVGSNDIMIKGKLPEELANKIKKVHENGWFTGSKGWGGKWKEDIAKQVLLRTHTTVLSAITLSKLKKEDLPAKFFNVGRVYRNEALDWKHLFEFYQVDGIVVDPNANLRHLIGYLREFYRKMGYSDVKIKPSYFPYVEPGCEVFAYNPIKRQWVEVGGAGIFRPEVVKPLLGFDCPVLAWGQGIERIITNYWQINDLRQIYSNDLKQLRESKEFMM